MYDEKKLTPAQQELESALCQIRPDQDALNHELFMFRAGRASAGTKRPWQMLSGVLHDFKNPMAIISGYVQLMARAPRLSRARRRR